MSKRRDEECFHALKVIRRLVDERHESIEAAIAHVDGDRAAVDELRAAASVTELQVTCHLLIGERETLGKALENIRGVLDEVNITPRTENLGKGARRQ